MVRLEREWSAHSHPILSTETAMELSLNMLVASILAFVKR